MGGKEWGVARERGAFWGDESVWEINSSVCITIPNIMSLNYLLKEG